MRLFITATALLAATCTFAQQNEATALSATHKEASTQTTFSTQCQDPSTGGVGTAPLRSEFIGYDIREEAERNIREVSPFYLPLNMFATQRDGVTQLRTRVEIPYMWLDRDLFLHVEGIPTLYVGINDKRIAYGQDSRAPIEFNISKHVTNGLNTISLESISDGVGSKLESAIKESPTAPVVFLYSQPKLRIENYMLRTEPDSTGKHCVLKLDVALANSYNSPEQITFGYDIYSPQGKLLHYDMRDVKLKGQARDTLHFKELIYAAMQNLWSTDAPHLYKVMLYVKRAGRMTEYVPIQAGFGTVAVDDGAILRNGKMINLKLALYNGAATSDLLSKELALLKLHGINTVILDYPQPWWFYNMCDKVGMNVIDQANINTNFDTRNPNVGGALSNNPLWLGSFMERIQRMYARNHNHACIVGLSLGSEVGNGYNMYKCYEWLKNAESSRAVIFRDAQGQWNNDIELPEIVDAQVLLATPPPAVKPQTTRRRR